MIAHFRCDNFKSLRGFNINLNKDLTVIAGPNGSGKTSICQALSIASRLVYESPQIVMDSICPDYEWNLIRNKWESDNKPFFFTEVREVIHNNLATAIWGIQLVKHEFWGILLESVDYKKNAFDDSAKWVETLSRTGHKIHLKEYDTESGQWNSFKEIKELPSYVSTVVPETKDKYPAFWMIKNGFKVKYIPLLNPIYLRSKTKEQTLGDMGQNFASYLSNFKRNRPQMFKEVVEHVKSFFPNVVDIAPKSGRFGWTEIKVTVKPDKHERNVEFRANQINDGLLRLLFLATIPYAEPDLNMLVFEEPENGIHPKLLKNMVELLRSFNIQVVLTTHSPVLLNFMEPEDVVLLMPQGVDGPVAIPFKELDKAEERLEYFDIGDILYNEHEHKLALPYLKKLRKENAKKR